MAAACLQDHALFWKLFRLFLGCKVQSGLFWTRVKCPFHKTPEEPLKYFPPVIVQTRTEPVLKSALHPSMEKQADELGLTL